MKKQAALATAILCLSLVLASCGTSENPDSASRTDHPSVSDPAETKDSLTELDEPKSNGAGAADSGTGTLPSPAGEQSKKEQTAMKMNVQIGAYTFTATLEDNEAVRELAGMMRQGPVSIAMNDYAGFEKVGPLGRSLTTSNSQTTTTAGDIVLYNGSSIVIFYGSNSWSYTRIGRIDDLTDWKEALGSGSVTAIFTLAE